MNKLFLFLLIPISINGAAYDPGTKSIMDYFRRELRSGKRTNLFARLSKGETLAITVNDGAAAYLISTENAYDMIIEAIKEMKQDHVNEIMLPKKGVGMGWGYE